MILLNETSISSMIDLSRLISLNRIMNILPPVLINQIETKSQRLYNNDV